MSYCVLFTFTSILQIWEEAKQCWDKLVNWLVRRLSPCMSLWGIVLWTQWHHMTDLEVVNNVNVGLKPGGLLANRPAWASLWGLYDLIWWNAGQRWIIGVLCFEQLQSEVEKPFLAFRENFKKDMKRFDHHIADLRKQLVGRYAAVEKVLTNTCRWTAVR